MRVALHSTIRAGAIDDYRKHHARVPDGLVALFDSVGIRDWSIWRSGDRLFHLVECDDFAEAMRRVAASPVNDAWQSDIGRFVEDFYGPGGEVVFEPIEAVWSLSDQRDSAQRAGQAS
jgi:L-rhamnose mutarotase